jgi:hypothetical protein
MPPEGFYKAKGEFIDKVCSTILLHLVCLGLAIVCLLKLAQWWL